MKSTRKYSFGLFALVALLSVVFITASPNSSVQAQASPNASAAAVNVVYNVTSGDTSNAVFTIDWTSRNCSANTPLGGTIHDIQSSTHRSFGSTGGATELLTTHVNTDTRSQSSNGSNPCTYVLTVTSNLNCTLSVTPAGVTAITDAVVTEPPSSTNSVSVNFAGTPVPGTEDADFFAPSTERALQGNAVGSLNAGADTASSAVTVSTGGITIEVGATACENPEASSSFVVGNAEPVGSLELAVTVAPLANCDPARGVEGEIIYEPSDNPALLNFDPDCRYDFDVNHATSQSLVTSGNSANALRASCSVDAIAYIVDTSDALSTEVVSSEDQASTRLTFTRTGRASISNAGDLVQLTLYISGDCPQIGRATFNYQVVDIQPGGSAGLEFNAATVPTALQSQPITVSVVPVAASAANGCFAVPAPGGSATIASTTRAATFIITTQPRRGSICQYTVTYPIDSGALSLRYERAPAIADPLDTTDADTMALSADLDEEQTNAPTTDGQPVNGVITANATILQRGTTFTYESRNLPIEVTMNFPAGTYTTDDIVQYRISVVGPCARFPAILERSFQIGTSRSLQVVPLETIVFSPELGTLERTTPPPAEGPIDYELEPVIIIRGEAKECSVQVEEVSGPSNCELNNGGKVRTVTFAEGLSAYEFNFDHDCTGLASRSSSRQLTG